MPKITRRTLTLPGGTLEYTLERKRVKNLNLHVRPDGSVYVSAGQWVSAGHIDAFVASREDFVRRAQAAFRQRASQLPPERKCVTGEGIPYLGGELTLTVVPGSRDRAYLQDSRLILEVRDPQNHAKKQRLLASFLDGECRRIFTEILENWYPRFQKDTALPTLRIRSMKSRWGSCIPSKGIITLNKRLLEAPWECIEYVAVHEYCHFRHPDHSKAFYASLEGELPDWKARKKQLNQIVI